MKMRRRQPVEVTADRLLYHLEQHHARLGYEERAVLSRARAVLHRLAALPADPPAALPAPDPSRSSAVPCDRLKLHAGACLERCTATPGCTDPARHRGRCTTGLWSPIAQSWARSAATRCAGRVGDYPDDAARRPDPPRREIHDLVADGTAPDPARRAPG